MEDTKTKLEKMVKEIATDVNRGNWKGMVDNALEIRRTQSLVDGVWVTDGYEIVITTGGPTIWIDTRDCCVYGAWWGERAEEGFEGRIAAEIDAYLDEIAR